ncbi:MAG: 5'-methylthioadenosine/S-adenosylhomocysteine nucleosidase [Deltaproteobacteria bacterium]|nr:5'-methylthioadenosine/S-adenosylhomocysteine nucleosidase [Deltaproteobacteria bacterium]
MTNQVENNFFIGIIIATPMEADPFINGLGLKEVNSRPFPVYAGGDILLAVSGIGKVNAALATAYACMRHDPACILNLGAAGAVQDSEKLGSIYNITKTVEPDRIHLRTNSPYVQHPDTLSGFDKATLATQDKAINDADIFRSIASYADLVDMEGAAVVQASRRFGRKCLLFKFVSDTPLHAGQPEIISYIKRYREPFSEAIISSAIPALRAL